MHGANALCALILGLIVTLTTGRAANAQETAVALHLVLAVDVSWSMDPDEQRLQRDGYVEAFRDAQVIKAIRSGQAGRIAVTYFEWAGADIHFMVVPWTVVDGPEAAHRLADELARRRIGRHRMTSISSAMQYARRLLDEAPGQAPRRVIDISGDGPNNGGVSPVTLVRDELLAEGIVINGLPIMLKVGRGSSYGFGQDIADLDAYYTNCVIGGPGSFMIPVRERAEFATATRQKLLLEISGLQPPRIHRAQYGAPYGTLEPVPPATGRYDCLIGERNWHRYYLDRDRF